MINKGGDLTNFDAGNVPVLKTMLDQMCSETERTIYMDTVPVAKDLELGTRVIYDDGAGTKRIYWKTGKGNLGYVNLT